MFSNDQEIEIRMLISDSLDRAEKHWCNGGHLLINKSEYASESMDEYLEVEPSKIPGNPFVQEDETVIDEFIAFVADMRDSSKHLLQEISTKNAKVSRLQRVYYETSALLPALALTIKFKEGSVTEYLGDGVLALFKVDPENREKAIYAAHNAASNCINNTREIVNEILKERYSLPEIDLGVGLAFSRALVTLVGFPGEKHPKAVGECVFRATKLSYGKNIICIDKMVHGMWPTSKSGTLKFMAKTVGPVDGYVISK